MIDRNEIRACMARNGYTQPIVAEKIGISVTSFALKMQGKREFTEKEITSLVSLLGKGILILD